MDVSRPSRIVVAGLFLAMLPLLCFAQARPSGYDPAAQEQPPKQKDGFVDFALKRINPADKDYGQCLDEGRKLLLEETIRNGYFWSNLVALGLLACLFVIIVYQHRVQTCREWTAAEMLAQHEHALARANAQVEEATSRNRGLMEALSALRESALRSQAPPGEVQDRPAPQTVRSRDIQHTGQPGSDTKEWQCHISDRPLCECSDRNTARKPAHKPDRTLQTRRRADHEGQFAGATAWPVPG